MPRILVVDDDPDQLEIRRLLLMRRGHEIFSAQNAGEALAAFDAHRPEVVLMDLHLPSQEDGLGLIRGIRSISPDVRIVVLSGWEGDLPAAERGMVSRFLRKPFPTDQLLQVIGQLAVILLLTWLPVHAQRFPFAAPADSEYVASIEMSAPGGDWAAPGREGAIASIRVDAGAAHHVMVASGPARVVYNAFLGRVSAGSHRLDVERDPAYSAPGAGLSVHGVRVSPASSAVAHAPILFGRQSSIGKFSDVPLAVYCERAGPSALSYSVVFSNEDGGTSTRALMARWGRTTDIEHAYVVELTPDGKRRHATIQSREHKEIPYRGRYEGDHPFLIPCTENNMFCAEGTSALRFQYAPEIVEFQDASRDEIMDRLPWTWLVMAKELAREGRLRPFGIVDGMKISDPRNYVYAEMKIANRQSRLTWRVRLDGESLWRAAHIGSIEMAIERDGWVRSALELPPGTPQSRISEVAFDCLLNTAVKPVPLSGECRVESVGRVFRLDDGYHPQPGFWRRQEPFRLTTGEMKSFTLNQTDQIRP